MQEKAPLSYSSPDTDESKLYEKVKNDLRHFDFTDPKKYSRSAMENKRIIRRTLVAYGIENRQAIQAARELVIIVSKANLIKECEKTMGRKITPLEEFIRSLSYTFISLHTRGNFGLDESDDGAELPVINIRPNQREPWYTLGHELWHYAEYLTGKGEKSQFLGRQLFVEIDSVIIVAVSLFVALRRQNEYFTSLEILSILTGLIGFYSLIRSELAHEERTARKIEKNLKG